jgi:hypothetical protein
MGRACGMNGTIKEILIGKQWKRALETYRYK